MSRFIKYRVVTCEEQCLERDLLAFSETGWVFESVVRTYLDGGMPKVVIILREL